MLESADAIDDSDDEVDYTKMDQGNKKGPVGRWDFDTQEEYSDYMSNKEALPKYVFLSLMRGMQFCYPNGYVSTFCNLMHNSNFGFQSQSRFPIRSQNGRR